MTVRTVVNSFNAGELSPRMLARPEVDSYSRGCRILQNFVPTDYGAVERRPGTVLTQVLQPLQAVQKGAENALPKQRLLPFVFNDNNAYVLAVGADGSMKVFKDGKGDAIETTAAASSDALPTTIDPWKIQYTQSADVLYLVSPEFAPRLVKRTLGTNGNAAFSLETMEFEIPPTLDLYTGAAEIKCSKISVSTGATLTASSALFTADDVGRTFVITHRNGTVLSAYGSKSSVPGWTSYWLPLYGAWTFQTRGTWTGEIDIYRHYGTISTKATPADDELLYHYESENDFNLSLSGDESDRNAYYYFKWTVSSTGTKIGYTLTNPGYEKTGVVLVTAVASEKSATCNVLSPLLNTNYTNTFRRGAFSPADGYPGAVCIFQERLFFGGTNANQNRIWGSGTNDWTDFLPIGNEDDSGLDFTLSSETVCRVCWMTPIGGALLLGTTEDEWEVTGGSRNEPLTASSLLLKRNSAYGSKFPSRCVMAQDMLVFVQKDGKRLRSMRYSWESDSYSADELTLLARHVFDESPAKEMTLQRFPDTVLWCLREDGVPCSATINTAQNVTGWQRSPMAGKVFSLCSIPDADGEDRLALNTEARTPMEGDGTQEYVSNVLCLMNTNGTDDFPASVYLDQAFPVVTATQAATQEGIFATIGSERLGDSHIRCTAPTGSQSDSGIVNIDAPQVFVANDGRVLAFEELPESGGPYKANVCYSSSTDVFYIPKELAEIGGWIGSRYASIVSPMPPEFAGQDGHSLLRKKTINRVLVDKYDSRGGELRCNSGKWVQLDDRNVSDEVDDAAPTRTETVVSAPMGGTARRVWTEIRTSAPWPLNIAAVSQVISTEDA